MTNRRRSATTRSVPAQTPEQLLEQAQEHIRPLIGVIDRLNEADAEDELEGYQQTTHAAVLQSAAAPQEQITQEPLRSEPPAPPSPCGRVRE